MAESSRWSPEPRIATVDDYASDASAEGEDPPRERSPSSTGQRQTAYDSQRTSGKRPSRPVSGESQISKGKGKHSSYGPSTQLGNLDETIVPSLPGTGPSRQASSRLERRSNLEEGRAGPSTNVSSKRSSKRESKRSSVRHRASGTVPRDLALSEVAAPQPLPPPSSSANTAVPSGISRQQSQLKSKADPEPGYLAYSSDEALPPPFAAKRPEDYLHGREKPPPPDTRPKWLVELYVTSYLVFFAIFGTLARLGMQWLTFYPGAPLVTPVLWANVAGSLFLGFLSEDQRIFRDSFSPTGDKASSARVKKTIPLYIGLATGFCGSFTSFSSFMRDVFLALSNNLPTPVNYPYPGGATSSTVSSTVSRNGGYSFMALMAIILFTIGLSLGGLFVGAHIAIGFGPIIPKIPKSLVRKLLDPLMVIVGWGCWLGAIFLAIWPPQNTWRGEATFACVFAPAGCLLRYYASLKLNALVASFPLGTFAVNMLGTAVEGMCYDIQHVSVGTTGLAGGGAVGCQVLQGLMDGFCGTLTTVSTWVAEINGLRRRHGYVYALGSVVGGLCLMVIIMGSVRWSTGYVSPMCQTGYPDKVS